MLPDEGKVSQQDPLEMLMRLAESRFFRIFSLYYPEKSSISSADTAIDHPLCSECTQKVFQKLEKSFTLSLW